MRLSRHLLSVAALLLAGTAVLAQVTATVSPPVAPVGCEIRITLANDTNQVLNSGACPFTVQDSNGNSVFSPFICILIIIPIAPGQTHDFTWNQTDNFGNQVPPGNYTVTMNLQNGSTVNLPLTIGGVNAGLGTLGVQRPGLARPLYLCAPNDANAIYFCAASVTTITGVPTCAGINFPLDIDALFLYSTSAQGNFLNMVGALGPTGSTVSPIVNLPNDPALSGASYNMAFLTIDFSNPNCPIPSVSPALPITIQ